MINGLGVLGWGVGGIEAEAAMLGQAVSMLVPQVVGYKLTGKLREGATATDLVLTVTQTLRKLGVVGKFVEFYGPGIAELPLADRATISNMAPEYGATCGIFPVDAETLRYLRLTGRSEEQIALVEAYYKEQGLFHTASSPEAEYTQTLELDLAAVEPSVAGPEAPAGSRAAEGRGGKLRAAASQPARAHRQAARHAHRSRVGADARSPTPHWPSRAKTTKARLLHRPHQAAADKTFKTGPITTTVKERFNVDPDKYLDHGSVVIAAITSCTNTSNPSVMIAAGLLAKKAVEKGLSVPPWVKTSLAPGSRVVTDYYQKSGLLPYLEKLRFNVVGYGCTTCIGNSGPLPTDVSKSHRRARPGRRQRAQRQSQLRGPRQCRRARQLPDDPAAGRRLRARRPHRPQLRHRAARQGPDGQARLSSETSGPPQQEVADAIEKGVSSEGFRKEYATVTDGDASWQGLSFPTGDVYKWEPDSTYIRKAPYFDGMKKTARRRSPTSSARACSRCWAIPSPPTTSPRPAPSRPTARPGSISPNTASSRPTSTPTARAAAITKSWCAAPSPMCACATSSRRAPRAASRACCPKASQMSIFDASVKYAERGVPLVILAGKEYGSGSSRDWAAKGPNLLGVRAVIAESFERIHRSNLVGMGILPLQFEEGQNVESLGLTGEEVYDFAGLTDSAQVEVRQRPHAEGEGQQLRTEA